MSYKIIQSNNDAASTKTLNPDQPIINILYKLSLGQPLNPDSTTASHSTQASSADGLDSDEHEEALREACAEAGRSHPHRAGSVPTLNCP